MGKGEIACNKQFLLFPIVFSVHLGNFLSFSLRLKLSSANSSSLDRSKILSFGRELRGRGYQPGTSLTPHHQNNGRQP